MHARRQASNRLAKANRASHRPRVRAKERVKRTKVNPKEPKSANQVANGSHKGKTSKIGLSGLGNSKQRQARTPTAHDTQSWCFITYFVLLRRTG